MIDFPVEPFNDAEAIEHLEKCPGCHECQYLLNYYEACDNCGDFGNMNVMQGVVRGTTATALCSRCMALYDDDPESVYLVPEAPPIEIKGLPSKCLETTFIPASY